MTHEHIRNTPPQNKNAHHPLLQGAPSEIVLLPLCEGHVDQGQEETPLDRPAEHQQPGLFFEAGQAHKVVVGEGVVDAGPRLEHPAVSGHAVGDAREPGGHPRPGAPEGCLDVFFLLLCAAAVTAAAEWEGVDLQSGGARHGKGEGAVGDGPTLVVPGNRDCSRGAGGRGVGVLENVRN